MRASRRLRLLGHRSRRSTRTPLRGLPRNLPGIPAPSGLGFRPSRLVAPPPTASELANPERERVGRATALVAAGTLGSRLTGLLRILAAIYALGYSNLSDAFNLANTTPNIMHDIVLGGVLSATFVPVFVSRLASRPETEAVESISAIVTLSVVVLFVSTVVLIVGAPVVVALYTTGSHGPAVAAERSLATELLRFFAPQVLAYGLISLMTAVLSTVRRFSVPAFAPILNNLIAITVLIAFATLGHARTPGQLLADHSLLVLLGLGTTLGVVVQAAALVPSVRTSEIRLRVSWRPRDPAVREVVALSGWTFGFVIASQIAIFVVSALAVSISSATHTAALTAYTYASVFFQVPFGIVAVSVMATVTPLLSTRFTTGDLPGFAREFGLGLHRMMAGIVPATVGYLLLASPTMSLVSFGAGSASHAGGARLTSSLLGLLALGLPGFCTFLLAIRAFQAMRDTRIPFFLYLLETALNVGFAFALRGPLEARGLALALTLAYTIAALVALAVLRVRLGSLGGFAVGRYLIRTIACSVVMAFGVAVTLVLVGSDHGIGLLARVVAATVAGLVLYTVSAGLAGSASGWQTSRRRRAGVGRGRDDPHQDRD